MERIRGKRVRNVVRGSASDKRELRDLDLDDKLALKRSARTWDNMYTRAGGSDRPRRYGWLGIRGVAGPGGGGVGEGYGLGKIGCG